MKNPMLDKLKSSRRESVKSTSTKDLVRMERLYSDTTLPLLMYPTREDVDLSSWADENRSLIHENLFKHGCLLFRDFKVDGAPGFESFVVNAFKGQEMLSYYYRSTPRTHVKGKVYTSTEYPADTVIPLHNESAYANTWPMRVIFYCETPALRGGETPVADSRRIYQKIDPAIRKRFEEKGILYVRNFSKMDLDLSWQESFQTEDRAQVESFCRSENLNFEWLGDRLRTRQICQGTARHPITGESVWFNQAHLFHISGLKQEVREALLEDRKMEDLPRNSYYGDGSIIEDSVMTEIREVMEEEKVTFPWHKGDIMIMENMLAAHGRNTFKGDRRVLVSMVQAMDANQLKSRG